MPDIYSFGMVAVGALATPVSLKYVRDIYVARKRPIVKPDKVFKTKGAMDVKKFDSAYELIQTMEHGLELQADQIKRNLQGKDPMQDVGYMTVVGNLQRIERLRQRYEANPVYSLVDMMFWPMVREAPQKAIGWVTEMVSSSA